MGDVVLANFINDTPHAKTQMEAWTSSQRAVDVYIVIAKEDRRADALEQTQRLRDRGYRVDYPLAPAKVPKQFQTAEQLGARVAILLGEEWPQVAVKDLATSEQQLIAREDLLAHLQAQPSLSS